MKIRKFFISSSLFVVLLLHKALCTASENGCPNKSAKWKDLGGEFCYLIERNSTVPWIDAVYECHVEGGSLASFHSIEEVQRVVQYINNEGKRYYIGLWKHYDGSLEWVDKTPLDFRNWYAGEPNFPFEKCVEMYNSGEWNDIDCSTEMGYICSSPKIPSKPLLDPRKVCPYNSIKWEHYGGETCYIIEKDERVTWIDAQHRCSEERGSLASFHSVEEISAILQRTEDYNGRFHIGLRQGDHGKYTWIDGSSLNLDYWASGEPTNAAKICTEMDSSTGQWYDVSCEKTSGYICLSFKEFCGGDIYSDSGVIYSPMYPRYNGAYHCTWRITVPEDQQVVLQFERFELEYSNTCLYDFVKITDNHYYNGRLLGKYCGSDIPPIIRSSENKMALTFVSDDTEDALGFSAKFTEAGICTEYINSADRGELQSPNFPQKYGPGEKCFWYISLPENETVSLKFSKFAVEPSLDCRADFVEVYDGHQMSSAPLVRFCGWALPRRVQTTGNKMTVVFASDLSVEETGFSAEFQKGCGGDIFSERGVISTRNYPENYEADESCTWKITVPDNYTVVFQFKMIDVETSDDCHSDYVEIRDGHESGSRLIAKICGQDLLSHIYYSSTNKMSVYFVSDMSVQGRGFSSGFSKVSPCGGDIVAEKAVLQSPDFPDNYGPGLKCDWNIEVPEGYKISLKFLAFDVQFDQFCRDLLMVSEERESGGRSLGTFCGHLLPDDIVSTGNKMRITFRSDVWEERSGFSAEFEKDICGGNITSEKGIISSPNYPENYRRNEACTWKITVPHMNQVVLKFESFNLEDGHNCTFDFVEVRDGHRSDSPLLGKFCGTDGPEVIISSTNKMTVTFVSDTSYQRSGFNATFTKDKAAYELTESMLRELPALVLQHKLPKAKEKLLSKPKKPILPEVIGRIMKP